MDISMDIHIHGKPGYLGDGSVLLFSVKGEIGNKYVEQGIGKCL